MDYNYTKEQHTKTGADLWVVRLTSQVDRDEYKGIANKMRSIGNGGRWNRFKKGFLFYEDVEEQLEDIFGANDSSTITLRKNTTNKGVQIEKSSRINKNSKYLPYIKQHIKSATVYHLGYDEPLVTAGMDNDETDVENVIDELDKKSYDTLSYSGDGNFI